MRLGVTMFATDESMAVPELARDAEARGFTSLFIPDSTAEQARSLNDLMRLASTPETAIKRLRPFHRVDLREIASLIARGLSNRGIAGELVISPATAARHVANIFTKLGFSSRAQVAAWAVQREPKDGSRADD